MTRTITETIATPRTPDPNPWADRNSSRVPWDGPITVEALHAAAAYLDARPLAEQVAVITLVREVES